jgi:hypothetical protein
VDGYGNPLGGTPRKVILTSSIPHLVGETGTGVLLGIACIAELPGPRGTVPCCRLRGVV